MDLRAILNEFKSQVAFTLFLIWLLALRQAQDKLLAFAFPLFAIVLMTVLDLGITWVRSRKLYWPSASVVTGFLIGLIIDPSEPIWIIAIAVLAAFLSKQFIGIGVRQHIFNPAAFGIMASSLAFGVPVAWWGVAWGKLPLLILIPLMIRILWRMKRLMLPVTFLVVYFLFLTTQISPIDATKELVDGSVLLFALVMLPEPITSQARGKFKYGFGILVAILVIGFSFLKLQEVFLPALLMANLSGFLILRFGKTSLKSPEAKSG